MNNEQFVQFVHAFIERCGKDKARLFFVAHQVLAEMQIIDAARNRESSTPKEE